MSNWNKREIAALIVKYLQEDLSEDEARRLAEWRRESPGHEAAFRRYTSTHFYEDMQFRYTPGEERKLYRKLHKQLFHKPLKNLRGGVIWASAAVLLLLLAWGAMRYGFMPKPETGKPDLETCMAQIKPGSRQAVLYLANGARQPLAVPARKNIINGIGRVTAADGAELIFSSVPVKNNIPRGMNRIEVPRGGEYHLALSDKTRIYLNSESELQFPTLFADTLRKVAFRGEAYFHVASDEHSPFVITTSMGEVTVVGTAFNLRCYDDAGMLQLTLEEGRVRFTSPGGRLKAEVSPGEQLVYDLRADTLGVRRVTTYLYTSWTEGIYSFYQTPLSRIMDDLSRWYNVPVVYESDELKHITFTGEIKRYENFGEVVQILGLTRRVKFGMKGNAISIGKE